MPKVKLMLILIKMKKKKKEHGHLRIFFSKTILIEEP